TCHSVLVECKVSRADFLADREKPFRQKPELGVGCERFYLAPAGLIRLEELPAGWGLLELRNGKIEVLRRSARNHRSSTGFGYEMNLLLASLRRVELRIEPQSITDFLKRKQTCFWKLRDGFTSLHSTGTCRKARWCPPTYLSGT